MSSSKDIIKIHPVNETLYEKLVTTKQVKVSFLDAVQICESFKSMVIERYESGDNPEMGQTLFYQLMNAVTKIELEKRKLLIEIEQEIIQLTQKTEWKFINESYRSRMSDILADNRYETEMM